MFQPEDEERQGTRGGTMLLWNQKKLTKINIDLPRPKGKMEWTAAAFKSPNGHKLVATSVYVAPDITKKSPDRFLSGLVERISNKMAGASILIGGDFNACDHRLEMNHPSLVEQYSPPTWPADNPHRRLDLIITDFPQAIEGVKTSQGLKHNDRATRSDHLTLTCKVNLKKISPAAKQKQTFEFRAGGGGEGRGHN